LGSLRSGFAIVLAVGATLASAATARADDTALAQSLFDDAKRLMDAGKLDVACPKFAESLRLDPTPGTRLNLAHCYEVQGKTASAYAQYKDVIRTAGGDTKRAGIAKDRVAALEPTLPHATLDGAVDVGAIIKLDGKPIDAAVLGTPFPIDPGSHVLEVSAPGKKTKTVEFQAEAGQPVSVALPALETAAHEDTGPKEPPKPVPVEQPSHDEVSQGKLIGGWVTVGVGVAALGVGVTFGALTLSAASDVKSLCPAGPCPTQEGIDKNASAHTDAVLADILIPVGLVAAGVGIFLVATSTTHVEPATARVRVLPSASRNGGGLFLLGSF
jgi:hypothetical protein